MESFIREQMIRIYCGVTIFKSYRLLIIVIGLVGLIFQLCAIANGMELTKVNFSYNGWGSYYTTSYGNEIYFAGYVGGGQIADRNIFTYNLTSNSGQLHRILMNDDMQQNLNMGDSMQLGEGYQFKIKDIDSSGSLVIVNLLKEGVQVDSDVIGIGGTYIYTKKVGNVSDLPIIAIHLESVFISNVSKTAFIKGIFEISETFIMVNPMNITSWGNNQTNDQSLDINVASGNTVNFNIKTNLKIYMNLYSSCADAVFVSHIMPDSYNYIVNYRFPVVGTCWVELGGVNTSTGTSDRKRWTINVGNPMSIISWSNNETNGQQLSLTVPQGVVRRFNVTTNYNYNIYTTGSNASNSAGGFTDLKNIYVDIKFYYVGTFWVTAGATNNSYGSANKTWYVTVIPSVYKVFVDDYYGFKRVIETTKPFLYENLTLNINAGDTIIWVNDASNNEPLTIISEQNLWNDPSSFLKYNAQSFNYTFTQPGIYGIYIKEHPRLQHQKIIVNSITNTPTPTSTPPTPTPTSTIQIPDAKRAQLQVTYDTSLADNERITIKVILKNIGNAIASNINLTIDHTPDLGPIVFSGCQKIGETIIWNGELKPNEEHICKYSIKGITGKYLEIPLKATYFKISPEEKANALGVSSAPLTPDEQEIIIMIIRALLPKLTPGFEAIVAIMLLILISAILKNRRGGC